MHRTVSDQAEVAVGKLLGRARRMLARCDDVALSGPTCNILEFTPSHRLLYVRNCCNGVGALLLHCEKSFIDFRCNVEVPEASPEPFVQTHPGTLAEALFATTLLLPSQ